MSTTYGHKYLFWKTRADFSAILIIAFIFQFLFPVFALSDVQSHENAFVQDLRQNICFGNQQNDIPQSDQQHDFYCAYCLLNSLPDTIFFTLTELSQTAFGPSQIRTVFYIAIQDNSGFEHIRKLSYPRAPPVGQQ